MEIGEKMETPSTNELLSEGLKAGLITGLLAAGSILLGWAMGQETHFDHTFDYIGIILHWSVLFLLGYQFRKKIGGLWSYKSVVTFLIISQIAFSVIRISQEALLYNVLDPSLAEAEKEFAIEKIDEAAEKIGDSSMLEGARDAIKDEDLTRDAGNLAQSFGMILLTGGAFSLLFAFLLRKNPPEQEFS